MSMPPAQAAEDALLQATLGGRAGSLALELAFELRSSWTVLFGPSGAGKSTVLRALCGLTTLPNQRVVLQGDDLSRTPAHRRRIALVGQQTALFPHMTALDNVVFGLAACADGSRSQRAAQAQGLLERFHAADAAGKYPRALSGGEQQRIALARAVASAPRLLLLDEAFTGLQTELRMDLVDEVKQWQRETGTPVFSVTHDVAEALASADEVLRMDGGRIVAKGTPQDVLAEERTALMRSLR